MRKNIAKALIGSTKMKIFLSIALWIIASSYSIYSAESTSLPSKAISSNPGAVNIETGTGSLGRALGLKKESGIRFGGLWIGDLNYLISGGAKPHKLSGNNVALLSLSVDPEKFSSWKGGRFAIEFLQFNGRPTNREAGTIQGYNSLTGESPLDRSELYQLWFRQELFNKKVVIRIGKTLPNVDFNNVLRPVPVIEKYLDIPATTSLIFTPVFITPSLLGVLPGYYNSCYGITVTVLPTDFCYISYGGYDGNLARGKQTGLRGPQFNGYYFHIAEVGCVWRLKEKMPGNIAIGGWYQSGKLSVPFGPSEKGTGGVYVFGAQRLWFRHPGVDNSGISGFFQGGVNNSRTLPINQYLGAGLTFFGLTPKRLHDSFGCGVAISWLNPNRFSRSIESILQGYYQAYLFDGFYFLSALTYIPRPGAAKDLPAAYAVTARLIALF